MLRELVMLLLLTVNPRIAFGPATLHVRVQATEGASIVVIIDSGDGYYTRRDFAREEGRKTYEMDFKDVPPGNYEVIAATADAAGKVIHQTSTTVELRGRE